MPLEGVWATLKETWPFVLIVGGHVMRTETRAARLQTEINNLKDQRSEDLARMDRRFDEVRGDIRAVAEDIKHLLERKD